MFGKLPVACWDFNPNQPEKRDRDLRMGSNAMGKKILNKPLRFMAVSTNPFEKYDLQLPPSMELYLAKL